MVTKVEWPEYKMEIAGHDYWLFLIDVLSISLAPRLGKPEI